MGKCKLNVLEKAYAYGTTWAEMAIENYPFTSALIVGMILDRIIW